MAEGREKEDKAIIDNVSKFVMSELRADFPEITGFGIGVKPEGFGDRYPSSMPQEEVYRKLGFIILLEKDISEEKIQRIKMRIADKLIVSFFVVGRVEPL